MMHFGRRGVLQGLAATPALGTASIAKPLPSKWRPLAEDVRSQMARAWRNYVERRLGAAPDRVTNALRPEFPDSCINLFLLDPDERWRELGRIHYENMKRTSRAPYGFTVIDDIVTSPMKQGDLCPGYWWSEQMKYYWLLFSDTDRFDYKTNYLSTEGNVFVGLR